MGKHKTPMLDELEKGPGLVLYPTSSSRRRMVNTF